MTVKETVIVCSLNFIKSCGAELPAEGKSSKEYQWKIPEFFLGRGLKYHFNGRCLFL